MMNELKDICDKLEGYRSNQPEWVIRIAQKLEDGAWRIEITKPEEEQEAENAD